MIKLVYLPLFAILLVFDLFLQAEELVLTPNEKRSLQERSIVPKSEPNGELSSYYDMFKDPTVFRQKENQHFRTTLELDRKTGDIVLSVVSKRMKGIGLNLEYNFYFDDVTEEFMFLDVCPVGKSSQEEIIKGGNEVFKITKKIPDIISGQPYDEFVNKGHVTLTKGEQFCKRLPIWECKRQWEYLLRNSTKKPNTRYDISYMVVIKVDGKFYLARPAFEIDDKAIQAMKSLQARLEKAAKTQKPETYPKGIEFEVEKNENGTIIMRNKNHSNETKNE